MNLLSPLFVGVFVLLVTNLLASSSTKPNIIVMILMTRMRPW